ncbi:MAG: aspartate kinase [Planctomycetaceae bacterium]|nr:aspartate kinase [Planctomycetaceae bacterium]
MTVNGKPILVQKFGGSSLSDTARLEVCADRVVAALERGYRVVVVVSAMGRTTDRLLDLAGSLGGEPDPRALDLLLATGELASTAMMAMALAQRDIKATPLGGREAGIRTDPHHGRARILSIDPTRLSDLMSVGVVPIVAGFQGGSPNGEITTIGRGGSDTTAVAIAAALDAGETGGGCEIHTDVDGIHTADPRIVGEARRVDVIGSDEMLELAAVGAGVLQERAVVFARRYDVPLRVLHSQHGGPGTVILREVEGMERNSVVGCALRRELGRVGVSGLSVGAGPQSAIFSALADAGVMVDDIVQTADAATISLAFTVDLADLPMARDTVRSAVDRFPPAEAAAVGIDVEIGLAKVSVVGSGMRSTVGVAGRMFEALADSSVPILNITTSEIRISCLVPQDRGEIALSAVHEAFGLDAAAEGGPSLGLAGGTGEPPED